MKNVTSFAEVSVIRIAERLANDAEAYAKLLETRGIEVSGPEALRHFASIIRKANVAMKDAERNGAAE